MIKDVELRSLPFEGCPAGAKQEDTLRSMCHMMSIQGAALKSQSGQ